MKTLLLLILSWFNPITVSTPQDVITNSYKTIQYQDAAYAYEVFTVTDSQKLKLIPNYEDHISSRDLIANNNCQLAINGGFYAQDNEPLGLVLADSTEVSKVRPSELFNGFLSIDSNGDNLIADTYLGNSKIILQSGPRIIVSHNPVNLKLHDDKLARRMVAATTISGNLVFMTLFHPQTETSGPLLENLPSIVQSVANQEHLVINEAINLDGGRASMFHSPSLSLSETNPIGSMFCIQ